jgi:hypothetical protein
MFKSCLNTKMFECYEKEGNQKNQGRMWTKSRWGGGGVVSHSEKGGRNFGDAVREGFRFAWLPTEHKRLVIRCFVLIIIVFHSILNVVHLKEN